VKILYPHSQCKRNYNHKIANEEEAWPLQVVLPTSLFHITSKAAFGFVRTCIRQTHLIVFYSYLLFVRTFQPQLNSSQKTENNLIKHKGEHRYKRLKQSETMFYEISIKKQKIPAKEISCRKLDIPHQHC
jgi:hypothetical protein